MVDDFHNDIALEQKALAKPKKNASKRDELLPYKPKHIQAQRLMAVVVDPDTGGVMTRQRIAKLCGVDAGTLWRWIVDPSRGGKVAWYEAVGVYIKEVLEERWALMVRVQMDEALKGKAKIGAFRNIARLIEKIGPDISIQAGDVNIQSQIIVTLPDNGRSKITCPDAPGKFKRVLKPGKN